MSRTLTSRNLHGVLLALALSTLAQLACARLDAGRRADPPPAILGTPQTPGRGPPLMLPEANRAYERALGTGARLWKTRTAPLSANGQSCAGCHGADAAQLAGVSRRYPKLDAASGRVIPLEQRVAACVQLRMRGQAPAPGSAAAVALLVYLKESR